MECFKYYFKNKTNYEKQGIASTVFFKEIKGKNHQTSLENCNESKTIQKLVDDGYGVVYIGPSEKVSIWNGYNIESDYNEVLTVRYWKMLNLLMISAKPLVLIVHCLVGTHDPYLHPLLKNIRACYGFYTDYKSELIVNQIEASSIYADREIEYYSEKF